MKRLGVSPGGSMKNEMNSSETEKYCLFAIDVLYSHLFKTDSFYEQEVIDLE